MYLCVRGISRGISQKSELSCICVLEVSAMKVSCYVFVC